MRHGVFFATEIFFFRDGHTQRERFFDERIARYVGTDDRRLIDDTDDGSINTRHRVYLRVCCRPVAAAATTDEFNPSRRRYTPARVFIIARCVRACNARALRWTVNDANTSKYDPRRFARMTSTVQQQQQKNTLFFFLRCPASCWVRVACV